MNDLVFWGNYDLLGFIDGFFFGVGISGCIGCLVHFLNKRM